VALIILDASVVIAQSDRSDAYHEVATAAIDLRLGNDLRLPASAYAEATVIPARLGALEQSRRALEELGIAIEPIDRTIAERCATLRAETPSLRLGDALVLGCAYELGADEVLTADRRWAGLDRVTVLG